MPPSIALSCTKKNSMHYEGKRVSLQFRALLETSGGGWWVVARDHLIPHFEPRAFENFAALEPTPSFPLSFLHPSRSDQRQILVELGAGQRKGGISKVCQVSLQIGRSLSLFQPGWLDFNSEERKHAALI